MKLIPEKFSKKCRPLFFIILLCLSLPLLLFMQSCSRQKIPEPTPTRLPTLAPEFVDSSWYTDEPCQAPCWYGLQLEESTLDDAILTVEGLSFIDDFEKAEVSYDVWDYKSEQMIPSISYYGYCVEPDDQKCVQIIFSGNLLKRIQLYPNQYYSMGDVVEVIGTPDKIYVNYIYPETRSNCGVMLFWKQRDIAIMHDFKPYHEWEIYFDFNESDLCKLIMENDYKIPKSLSIDLVSYDTQVLSIFEANSYEVRGWNGFLDE